MIKKNQRGGTIIEVLIAALIFSTALFALVEFQANLLQERMLLEQESEALSLAQDKMQYFRNYTVLNTTLGAFAYQDIVTGSASVAGLNTTYALAWTVTDVLTPPTRKNVSITATWTDATNTAHTVTVNSLIASIDPKVTGKVSETLP